VRCLAFNDNADSNWDLKNPRFDKLVGTINNAFEEENLKRVFEIAIQLDPRTRPATLRPGFSEVPFSAA